MTAPRMCHAGVTYLVTRTCSERRFLLRPDETVNQVVEYCMALAARVTGVELHAACFESNHYHMVLTDLEGRLSEFQQLCNRAIACGLMERYEQTQPGQHLEGIWARGSFNATSLVNPAAVIKELRYTWTNMVKDGLVADYRKWPGFVSRPGDWLRTRTVKRPALCFNQDDPELAEIEYQFTVPPMLRDVAPEPLVQAMQAQIRDAQDGHRARVFAEGRTFLGVKGVLGADPFSSPKTRRAKGTTSPTCAAGGDRELLLAAKRMVRSFRERYREAWQRYKQGLYAVFPAGTLAMRIRHRVPCDDADPPPWCYAAPCAA